MRIAVCDDIPFWAERVTACINNWAHERRVKVQIRQCISGEDVLFEMEKSGDFAVVFMDMKLKGISGVDAAKKIKERNPWTSVVFVTCYERYHSEALRFRPVYFLSKPIVQKEVFDLMDKITETHREFSEIYNFKYKHINYHIALRRVLYFVSEGRKIKILLETGEEYSWYETLNEVEEQLQRFRNHFVRIHQSYLVNSMHVERYRQEEVILTNKEILPVSRKRKEALTRLHIERLSSWN